MGRFAQKFQTNVGASRKSVNHWRFAQNGEKNHSNASRRECPSVPPSISDFSDHFARSANICLTFLRETHLWFHILERSATTTLYVTFLREAPTFFESRALWTIPYGKWTVKFTPTCKLVKFKFTSQNIHCKLFINRQGARSANIFRITCFLNLQAWLYTSQNGK